MNNTIIFNNSFNPTMSYITKINDYDLITQYCNQWNNYLWQFPLIIITLFTINTIAIILLKKRPTNQTLIKIEWATSKLQEYLTIMFLLSLLLTAILRSITTL